MRGPSRLPRGRRTRCTPARLAHGRPSSRRWPRVRRRSSCPRRRGASVRSPCGRCTSLPAGPRCPAVPTRDGPSAPDCLHPIPERSRRDADGPSKRSTVSIPVAFAAARQSPLGRRARGLPSPSRVGRRARHRGRSHERGPASPSSPRVPARFPRSRGGSGPGSSRPPCRDPPSASPVEGQRGVRSSRAASSSPRFSHTRRRRARTASSGGSRGRNLMVRGSSASNRRHVVIRTSRCPVVALRAFVTGGAGFIGRHLVRVLLDGGWRVKAFILESERSHLPKDANLEPVVGDITKPSTLRGELDDADAVFHLAALVDSWVRDPQDYIRVNVEGTGHVVDESLRAAVPRFLFTSSMSGIGVTPGIVMREDSPPGKSFGPYEGSKADAERLVAKAVRERGLPAITLIPSIVIGPGDTRNTGKFLLSYVNGDFPGTFAESSVLPVVDADDVARATLPP